jgi:hypothetical protein
MDEARFRATTQYFNSLMEKAEDARGALDRLMSNPIGSNSDTAVSSLARRVRDAETAVLDTQKAISQMMQEAMTGGGGYIRVTDGMVKAQTELYGAVEHALEVERRAESEAFHAAERAREAAEAARVENHAATRAAEEAARVAERHAAAVEEVATSVEHVSSAAPRRPIFEGMGFEDFVRSLSSREPAEAVAAVEHQIRRLAASLAEAGAAVPENVRARTEGILRNLVVQRQELQEAADLVAFNASRAGMTRAEIRDANRAALAADDLRHNLEASADAAQHVHAQAQVVEAPLNEAATAAEHLTSTAATVEEHVAAVSEAASTAAAHMENVAVAAEHVAEPVQNAAKFFEIVPELVSGANTELGSMDALVQQIAYRAQNLNFTNARTEAGKLADAFADLEFRPSKTAIGKSMADLRAAFKESMTEAMRGVAGYLEQPLKAITFKDATKGFTDFSRSLTSSEAYNNMRLWGDDLRYTTKQLKSFADTMAGFKTTNFDRGGAISARQTA